MPRKFTLISLCHRTSNPELADRLRQMVEFEIEGWLSPQDVFHVMLASEEAYRVMADPKP